MRHGRLTALAGAGAAALAAGAWLAVARLENAGGPPPGTAASGPVAAAATLPTPGPSGGLPEQAGGDGSSSADGSARRAARPSAHAPAAPFVQRFAAQPGVRPLPPRRSPTAKVSVPANVDGCDHNYGEKTQCIPARFPPDATDKCDWLKAHGFKTIRVVGTDRQKLDEDSDGVACNT